MQELKSKISFTKDVINSIYDNYAKSVFCDAARLLMQKGMLSHEEKRILSIATGKAVNIYGFFRKSCLIYLSNGILWENTIQKIEDIKRQLMLELSLSILGHKLEKKVYYSNEDKNLFSLHLNQQVNLKFNSAVKDGKFYAFYENNNEALRMEKNKECSITKDIDFLEQDRNPFNVNDDHPDAPEFTPYDLKNIPKGEWVRQFRSAYSIIKEKVPDIYDEIYNFLDAIVPDVNIYSAKSAYYKERKVSFFKIVTSKAWEFLVYLLFGLKAKDIDYELNFNIQLRN